MNEAGSLDVPQLALQLAANANSNLNCMLGGRRERSQSASDAKVRSLNMMVHRCTETAGLTGIATMLQLLVKYGANSSRRRTRAHGCVRIKQMHVHAHGAEHDPHAHSHSHSHVHMHGAIHSKGMANVLGAAVVVTLALVAVEFTAGYFGHSIALISDAVHNLTDVPTIFISWIAMRLAERPPTREHTYGYHRAGILAAFTNAFFLSIVAAGILYEAIARLRQPAGVNAGVMLWVSLIALLVNGGITLALTSGRRDLNVRSILVHSFGDALSNVGIIAGALAIRWFGVVWIDPLIAAVIGALVLWSGWGILRETTHILLEGLPRDMRLEDVARSILGAPRP